MEDDKKRRKKNKKKKNKQANEPTESDKLDAKESTSDSQSHVQEIGENCDIQVSEIADAPNDTIGHITADGDGCLVNGTKVTNLAEAEKQHWLDREATLEGKVNKLQAEKNAQVHKEACLEERIKQLMKEQDGNSEKVVFAFGLQASQSEKNKQLEDEKNASLQNEASQSEKNKQLEDEKNASLQNEARLKEQDGNSEKVVFAFGLQASQSEKNKQLEDEKNASLQNEARLKERLAELETEKDALIQKEGSCEQKIQQLQREMNSQLQKEASLEKEILQLKGEKDSWARTEAGFGPKFDQLVDEASLLNLKVVSLEETVKEMERERDSWILKENSAKESIASLTTDNTKLRAQVEELELSRDSLFSETQQLKEVISSLQLRINNLEMDKQTPENSHANYEAEAASALVEKLVAENSELVEKVNELYAELELRGVRNEQFPNVAGAVTAQSAEVAGAAALLPDLADRHVTDKAISEASKMIPVSDSIQSLEDAMVKDERNGELVNVKPGFAYSSEIIEEDEIVQIPLDENEVVEEINMEVAQNDDNVDVSLADAPLVGAPFRLISFVARYVSGADLVNTNTGRSG